MERCSGFRMVFLDDEWGGVLVVVVKDLEMRIVGNRKSRRVGVVVVVMVVVLSSILKGFFFGVYEERRTRNEERRTRNDERPLPACLSMIILRKKLILNKR